MRVFLRSDKRKLKSKDLSDFSGCFANVVGKLGAFTSVGNSLLTNSKVCACASLRRTAFSFSFLVLRIFATAF